MNVFWQLVRRNLRHYRWPRLLTMLALAAGVAVITGALALGDFLRAGLRRQALARLGPVDCALVDDNLVRAALAAELTADPAWSALGAQPPVPMLSLPGSAATDQGNAAASVTVLGVDQSFFVAFSTAAVPAPTGRRVLLSRRLADDLKAAPGDWLLLRLPRDRGISASSLFGRRDHSRSILTLRVEVGGLIPDTAAAFSLRHDNPAPRNLLADLRWLQEQLGLEDRVNTILVAGAGSPAPAALDAILQKNLRLEDYSLHLRELPAGAGFQLESSSMVLPPPAIAAARDAARPLGLATAAHSVYLANRIRRPGAGKTGPSLAYAMVAAAAETMAGTIPLADDEMILNQWAAEQLHAQPGELFELEFFVGSANGELAVETASFRLRAVMPMTAPGFDRMLVPEFRGITDSDSIADWDPPFPVDLSLVTQADEDYWNRHRAAPKVMLSAPFLRRLWSGAGADAAAAAAPAWLTSLRFRPADAGLPPAPRVLAELLPRLAAGPLAPRFRNLRAEALGAAAGSTDFGGLFLGMSFFIIVAAGMISALLLRFHNETRLRENGLLLGLGFSSRQLRRLLNAEQAAVVLAAIAIGLPAGLAYARLLAVWMTRQWAGTFAAPLPLQTAAAPTTLAGGAAAGLLLGWLACHWNNRLLDRLPPLEMLRGWRALERGRRAASGNRAGKLAFASLAGAGITGALTMADRLPATAFFGAGSMLLGGLLAGLAWLLGRQFHATATATAAFSRRRLALRTLARQPGRSLAVAAIIACATFILATTAAQRRDPRRLDHNRPESPTGAYKLILTTAVPLAQPLPAAVAQLAPEDWPDQVRAATVISCRRSGGDDVSCLNLQRPAVPRVLGLPLDFIRRGGFAFTTLTTPVPAGDNPWERLLATEPGGAVPCFVDAASAQWILRRRLGDIINIPGGRGAPVRLRIAGLLQPGIFAGDLLIAEEHFTRIFAESAGYSFFLLDAPAARLPGLQARLLQLFATSGMQSQPAAELLASFAAVQNTYISTFLALGGIGLLLGAAALLVLLLRQVHERRGEFAQMQALGFTPAMPAQQLLLENALLIGGGLAAGTLAALLAAAPQLAGGAVAINWPGLAAALIGIPAAMLVMAWITASLNCHSSFAAALRQE